MNLMAGMGRYLDSGDGSDISYENANDHIQGSSVGMADGPFYPTSYKYKMKRGHSLSEEISTYWVAM